MPRLSKIGAAALAAFGWTGLSSVTASYLVVAGGAGGGDTQGGGGGAGGLLTGTTSLNPTESYTVTVGAGGAAGSSSRGGTGNNSVFLTITANGGGGGGSRATTFDGLSGGSGGGGTFNGGSGGSGTVGQGNAGGSGSTSGTLSAGGGGGAGAVGGNGVGNVTGGAGGAGLASSISGTSTFYAGGGGGSSETVAAGAGGAGGGGAGQFNPGAVAVAGTSNTGGGGGGGYSASQAGAGGSGVVIISYVGAQQFGGGVVTSSGGNTIHTFTTSGTLSPLNSLTASYLIVAGGGGGGGAGSANSGSGGGGAGGLLSGSGLTIDTNSTYAITVGAGGVGGTAADDNYTATSGSNSTLSIVATAAIGGGSAPNSNNTSNTAPRNGGSGAGGTGNPSSATGFPGTGTSGQGFAGGNSAYTTFYGGGGGGGAGGVGGAAQNSTAPYGGAGGVGVSSSISGTATYYAGGGGGGVYNSTSFSSGGNGGGGAGGGNATTPGTAGTANLGGGGGGTGGNPTGPSAQVGGNGGSGVVIISYPGSTQQMAGGTVTVAGGNVIHTFTSSGYLAPIFTANNSLRFRSSASAYLNRTPATASNRQTWTWSGWIKRGTLSVNQAIFSASDGTQNNEFLIYFGTNDTITIQQTVGGSSSGQISCTTNAVFRDPSAWYHIVLAVDTTQATSTNRLLFYVNGVSQTFSGYSVGSSINTWVNNTNAHAIAKRSDASLYFDGYMTEINFVDGQALTPNSFGYYSDLGVWQPIRYGGSYGTNGFYLPFTNTTSTTTLGYDFSPNGNNWTTNNISLTSGSTYDSMTDVPTNTNSNTANYCVLNTLDGTNMSYITVSNANLTYSEAANANGWRAIRGTIGVTSGKYRFSVYGTIGASTRMQLGLCTSATDLSGYNTSQNIGVQYNPYDADVYVNGSATSYGSTQRITAVFDFIFDASTGKCWVAVNGTLLGGNPDAGTGQMATFTTTSTVFPVTQAYGSSWDVNFGQRPWDYTIATASNFYPLNTFNLTTPTIGATAATTANEYFDATLYTGNGSTQTITNSGSMQPDLVWIKSRNFASFHALADSVRGVSLLLNSNATSAESTQTNSVTSLNSNGFSLGADTSTWVNYNTSTFVAWQWRASNATAVTNTAGTISSQVSANTTSGFSVVTWVHSSTTSTIGHGLGVAPTFVIVKSRTTAYNWDVGCTSIGWGNRLNLNTTDAAYSPAFWNSTAPTSTVFTYAGSGATNGDNMVAYCFTPIAGYSAFGSYTGNGSSDGTFVFTGFRPRFLMIKASSFAGESWYLFDTARNTYNVIGEALVGNQSSAEFSFVMLDILSNGFKARTTNSLCNTSGATYIYMAFAESPFKYANAR